MGILSYSSNNSGGSWWLDDATWQRLENAGWTVHWERDAGWPDDPKDLLKPCEKTGQRWMGALATSAAKEFATAAEGVAEFEKLTYQNASDTGCTCCGPPHNFTFYGDDGEISYGSARITETTLNWS